MTKIHLHLLAAAVLTLAGCDNEDAEPMAVRDCPSFSATIAGVRSRAKDTSWEEGDQIGISIVGSPTVKNILHKTEYGDGYFTVSDPAQQIIFTDDKPVKFTAYYPYGTPDASGKIATYSKITSSITQTPANQKKFDYLWAEETEGSKSNPDVKFRFVHKMSKITLVFTSDDIDLSTITAFTVGATSGGGLILNGTFDPFNENGKCETTTTTERGATVILKNFNVNVTDGVPAPPIIVFPQTLKNNPILVSVTAASANIGTKPVTLTSRTASLRPAVTISSALR